MVGSGSSDEVVTAGHRARTREAYDTVADDYAHLLPDLRPETRLDVAMIDDFAARCVDARLGPAADVGCGAGRVSAHLAARGVDVIGVDLSTGMVEAARRAHPHLRFAVGDLADLPLDRSGLGGLLAWYSLIHTAPKRLPVVVRELARVVAPDGWLLTAFQAGDGEVVERSTAYGHAVTLTSYRHDPELLVTVLTEVGFDVRARLRRCAEGAERTPQAVVHARRRD